MLRVTNDILRAIDDNSSAILLLLDLPSAFDTVDHSILLNRLEHRFGIKETALNWFRYYLTNRKRCVSIRKSTSSCRNLEFGVPQGPVRGPILYVLYTTPLGDILREHGVRYHLHADDTHMYLFFKSTSLEHRDRSVETIQNCAARLVVNARRHDHITPVLRDLHWLPVEQRIIVKILLFSFKALNGLAPSYLSDLVKFYVPERDLRSSSQKLLAVPFSNMKSYGQSFFYLRTKAVE